MLGLQIDFRRSFSVVRLDDTEEKWAVICEWSNRQRWQAERWELWIIENTTREEAKLRSSVNLRCSQVPPCRWKETLKQWLGLPEQVMQSSESRFREWNNWWRPDTYLCSGCLRSEVGVTLDWLLFAPVPFGSASGVHLAFFSFIWKEPGSCSVGLLHWGQQMELH